MCKAEDVKHIRNSCCFCSAHHCPSRSMPMKNILKFTRCPPSAHICLSPLLLDIQSSHTTRMGRCCREAGGQKRVVLPLGPAPTVHVHQGDAAPQTVRMQIFLLFQSCQGSDKEDNNDGCGKRLGKTGRVGRENRRPDLTDFSSLNVYD